ncbi:hypothetical protein ACH46N_10510 [Streptomyces pristinaespiralis]|uniref:Uncharacterized protein n=2 Tax=Streptomyces pristinaespiralis TaxID=38300 RepID=B5HAR8_STRE2|nr:hypothetical protein [Streptomyces pristinaespiralis]ALC25082.1 hypothetical protein SPRI_6776 [Streptomyces pristinaespiralis]EDY63929.1 conserved hypothetical protein [Streptomyces pristinaespiralis ATCC 25486]QMU12657.1 hypothetical protein H3L99_02895 [Streptomyces pristinaespiralis]
MSQISFEELDVLAGEMLPERAVLSTVVPFNNWGGGGSEGGGSSSSAVAIAPAASDQNGITSSACTVQEVDGTPGLVGALGLGSNNPSSGMTCMPSSTSVF